LVNPCVSVRHIGLHRSIKDVTKTVIRLIKLSMGRCLTSGRFV